MIKNTRIRVGVKVKPAFNNSSIIDKQEYSNKHPTLTLNLPKNPRKFNVDAIHDANNS